MLNRVKAGVNGAGVIRAHKVKDRAFDSGQFFDFGPKAGGGGGRSKYTQMYKNLKFLATLLLFL
jgi:hypothetical protein